MTGLRTGQVLHLDGTDWRVGLLTVLPGGRRDVTLTTTDGAESVTIPLPKLREPNRTGLCLADEED